MRIFTGRMHQSFFQIGRFLGAVSLWIISSSIACASQSASLQWSPETGTNVAGYALYVGTNSGNYTSRIDVTTNTLGTVSGLTNGTTYYFVVTAYDPEDVESTPSNEADFVAPGSNPPTLNAVTNYNMAALGQLTISNSATDPVKTNVLTYSLDPGAPTNMNIDSTNGVLEW